MREETHRTLIHLIAFDILLLILFITMVVIGSNEKHWLKFFREILFLLFYHLSMRLVVGQTVTAVYRNREFDQQALGFRLFKFEEKLYKVLNVKRWKKRVITAKPEQFDIHSICKKELLHNVMQAELVHRIIMVFSLFPIVLTIRYGTPLLFCLSSVLAFMIDLKYVMIQRYNRPRIVKLMNRKADYEKE